MTAPTLDDLIEARVAGYVGTITEPLETEIEQLKSQLHGLLENRWPACMFRVEAARYLGMHPDTLDSLVRQGLIAPVQLPGISQRAYPRNELDRFIESGGR